MSASVQNTAVAEVQRQRERTEDNLSDAEGVAWVRCLGRLGGISVCQSKGILYRGFGWACVHVYSVQCHPRCLSWCGPLAN